MPYGTIRGSLGYDIFVKSLFNDMSEISFRISKFTYFNFSVIGACGFILVICLEYVLNMCQAIKRLGVATRTVR